MMEATTKWWNTNKSKYSPSSLALLLEVTTTVHSVDDHKDRTNECSKHTQKGDCDSDPGCTSITTTNKKNKKRFKCVANKGPEPEKLVQAYTEWLTTGNEQWTFHSKEGNFTHTLE